MIIRSAAGDGAEAIELYQHAVEVEPSNASAHLNLGFLLIEAGDKKAGQAELDTAVQLDPTLADRIPGDASGPGGVQPDLGGSGGEGKPGASGSPG